MKTTLAAALTALSFAPSLHAAATADGAAVYARICQGCHMSDAQGAEGAARYPALAKNPRLASSLYPVQMVLDGRRGMPPFRDYLDDAQVAAVVNHVRSSFGNTYTDPVAAADVEKLRRPSEGPPPTGPFARLEAPRPAAASAGPIRHRTPGSDFPILMAVEVPAGYRTIYLSGVVPSMTDGDTKAQTISVFQNIERNLKRLNLAMSDVIKMQVFLVGDPNLQGKMDFKGMMEGYTQFFGTKDQPNLPTRSVFQVGALANPGWLVEIEVVAAVKDDAR